MDVIKEVNVTGESQKIPQDVLYQYKVDGIDVLNSKLLNPKGKMDIEIGPSKNLVKLKFDIFTDNDTNSILSMEDIYERTIMEDVTLFSANDKSKPFYLEFNINNDLLSGKTQNQIQMNLNCVLNFDEKPIIDVLEAAKNFNTFIKQNYSTIFVFGPDKKYHEVLTGNDLGKLLETKANPDNEIELFQKMFDINSFAEIDLRLPKKGITNHEISTIYDLSFAFEYGYFPIDPKSLKFTLLVDKIT